MENVVRCYDDIEAVTRLLQEKEKVCIFYFLSYQLMHSRNTDNFFLQFLCLHNIFIYYCLFRRGFI